MFEPGYALRMRDEQSCSSPSILLEFGIVGCELADRFGEIQVFEDVDVLFVRSVVVVATEQDTVVDVCGTMKLHGHHMVRLAELVRHSASAPATMFVAQN